MVLVCVGDLGEPRTHTHTHTHHQVRLRVGGYDLIWDGGPAATAGDPELASRLGTRNTRADHRARMERQVGAMRGAGSARMALHSLSVCLFSFFFFFPPSQLLIAHLSLPLSPFLVLFCRTATERVPAAETAAGRHRGHERRRWQTKPTAFGGGAGSRLDHGGSPCLRVCVRVSDRRSLAHLPPHHTCPTTRGGLFKYRVVCKTSI